MHLNPSVFLKSMTTNTFFHFIKYLFPLGILIYSTWCGLGYTYDSYDYLSAARSFAAQAILINADGTPYFFHAPFFPIWISWLGHDALSHLPTIHTALFMISLLVLDRIIRMAISSNPLQILAFLAVSMGVGLHMCHHFIWTEPTFLVFFLIHNLCLISIIKSFRISTLSVLILSGFVLGITRNAGIFLLVPTAIILFFYTGKFRWKATLAYFAIASSGFALWNIYALMIVSKLAIFKEGSSFYQDIFASIWVYPDVISQWFLPAFVPMFLRITVLIGLLVALFILLRKYHNPITEVFIIQFFIYLVCISTIVLVDNSEAERLLSLVYPFLIISLFIILDPYWVEIKKGMRVLIYIALSLWIGYISIRTVKNSIMWHNNRCNMEFVIFENDPN